MINISVSTRVEGKIRNMAFDRKIGLYQNSDTAKAI